MGKNSEDSYREYKIISSWRFFVSTKTLQLIFIEGLKAPLPSMGGDLNHCWVEAGITLRW